jgi:choline dehydrogenase-like flavoprotein
MIIEGRKLAGDLDLSTEAVIVGSGASGAVVAKELAEAGVGVVVLEEGPNIPPEVYSQWRPSQSMRYLARGAGTQFAFPLGDSPLLTVLSGRTVGGSSTMTGGVCFRIPPPVLWRWRKELGLSGFSERDLEPAYQAVESEIQVKEVQVSLRSRGTRLFVEGATRLGLEMKPIARNMDGCIGWARCNFGCPVGAKYSVDVTYLKKASAAGMQLYSDCLVDRVLHQDGRAAGVIGRVLNGPGNRPEGKLRVRAKTVVLCAGTLHTPKILARTGVARSGRGVGRNITLHPAFRVSALFDSEVDGWKGAMQSAYIDALADRGITLIGIWIPIGFAAAGFPGYGSELKRYLTQVPHLAMFGGLVSDRGGGRLFRIPGREPLMTYRLHPDDKKTMLQAIRVLAECFFAAGARELMLPIYGTRPIDSPDGLKLLDGRVPGRSLECTSFHPLGSARMGIDPARACVSPSGETFDLPGLWVADGSVFPTALGVNTQLPIMTVATKIAWSLRERLRG